MTYPNIAIDGPAASGKTTVARILADILGLTYLDTGVMYRACAWKALAVGADFNDTDVLQKIAQEIKIEFFNEEKDGVKSQRVKVDGKDVTEELHSPSVSKVVSLAAQISPVRKAMVKLQQEIAKNGGVIMAGRDICSVVLPDAKLKYYLDASVEERAKRRFLELQSKESDLSIKDVEDKLRQRDHIDSTRDDSPLCVAFGSKVIDSTVVDAAQVVEMICADYREELKCPQKSR